MNNERQVVREQSHQFGPVQDYIYKAKREMAKRTAQCSLSAWVASSPSTKRADDLRPGDKITSRLAI